MCNTPGHWTPEHLLDRLRARGVRLAATTLYRNLALFEEAGVIRRVVTRASGEPTVEYEHVWGREHHDHLLCSTCGRRVEFHYPAIEVLQEAVAREHGFELRAHRLELIGLCGGCQEGAS
jgi:Fur family transcriptional regulator, ferric uptake regulator